ncbi:MAG: DNA recombination protein RmuC, partial [Saprospiraceae bacterium]
MEITSIIIGLAIGAVLTYIILALLSKNKHVARTEYDALNTRHNESSTNLKLTEEKLRSQNELSLSLQQRMDARQNEMSGLLTRTATLEATLKSYDERIKEFSTSLNEERKTNQHQQSDINKHLQALAEISAYNKSLQEKLDTQKQDILELQKTSHLQFEKLAQQIFEEKSGKFTESNKLNIEAILKPLSENIESFKKKVEETYDKESKERFSLGEKVKDLIENTNKVSQEANNLATALKGQVKKQGDWGETILENILERSGLVKNREYFVQENFKDESGNNVRPDITIHLPGNRKIILDSKVSLISYTRFCETDSKEEQDAHIKTHLRSLHTHIDQLSSKKYDELTSSLEFVVMFIPIEPAYLIAIQHDSDITEYASRKKIMMISPNNLIAVLKIVSDLWKREFQNRNALEIAKQGKSLYEKFVGFV